MPSKAEIYQLAAALFALLLGLMVYLFERPAGSAYLFAIFSYSHFQHYDLFRFFGQWLPSIVHTYAFILLTVLAVGNGPLRILISSFFWVGIGWLFEFGQHPIVSTKLATYIPEWFSSIPLLENSADYFQNGTFDPLDLLATLAGAFAAWATHQMAQQNGGSNESEK